ncbi:MAG: GreA/GreB family elongation factor, partial [Patescibacteria group bacterium]
EYLLKYVTVIESHKDAQEIFVGSKVKARMNDRTVEFTIVGSNEANPGTGFISNESPLGRAFLGHRKNETITVSTPRGETSYEILHIQ